MRQVVLVPKVDMGDWRQIRKFPRYEISSSGVIRNRSTKRVVESYKSKDIFDDSRKIMLLRDEKNQYEAHVSELYYDAFPEKRESVTVLDS